MNINMLHLHTCYQVQDQPHPLTRQTDAPIMGGTLEVSRQHRLRRKRRNSAACVVTLAKLQHVHLVLHTQNGYVS